MCPPSLFLFWNMEYSAGGRISILEQGVLYCSGHQVSMYFETRSRFSTDVSINFFYFLNKEFCTKIAMVPFWNREFFTYVPTVRYHDVMGPRN